MKRREFLSLSLGVAGLTVLTDTNAYANTKTIRLVRPEPFDLHYIGVTYQAIVERRHKFGYPRIARVEFRMRERLINTLTAEPYNLSWSPIQADFGQGNFTAQAFSGSGNMVWSQTVLITVTNLPPG